MKSLILLLSFILVLALAQSVYATSLTTQLGDLLNNSGIPGFNFEGAKLNTVLSKLLDITFMLMIFISFFWLVWGAFEYMAAGGSKEGLAKAKARITWAIVGLILVLLAYIVAQFAEQIIQPKRKTLTALFPVAYAQTPSSSKVDIGNNYDFGDITSLGQGVTRLVAPTFSIATTVVVFYFLMGAFKYLTAAGDKEAVSSAQAMITHAIIGFIILMFAFFVLQFVPQFFGFEGLKIF